MGETYFWALSLQASLLNSMPRVPSSHCIMHPTLHSARLSSVHTFVHRMHHNANNASRSSYLHNGASLVRTRTLRT
eukprot:6371085-Amphidinium_carterae.1